MNNSPGIRFVGRVDAQDPSFGPRPEDLLVFAVGMGPLTPRVQSGLDTAHVSSDILIFPASYTSVNWTSVFFALPNTDMSDHLTTPLYAALPMRVFATASEVVVASGGASGFKLALVPLRRWRNRLSLGFLNHGRSFGLYTSFQQERKVEEWLIYADELSFVSKFFLGR